MVQFKSAAHHLAPFCFFAVASEQAKLQELKMAEIDNESPWKRKRSWKLMMIRYTVSLISVLLTQISLCLLSHFFPTSSIPSLLSLSVVVMMVVAGLGRLCKKILGLRASAPAFVVINIFYVWCVYLIVIRPAISSLLDIAFNAELTILLIGLFSIMRSDPGYVAYGSSSLDKLVASPVVDAEVHLKEMEPSSCEMLEGFPAAERVRFCEVCKTYIKGFDHHCPGFANCIGQNNRLIFIILLVGFVMTESSYCACSLKFATKSQILYKNGMKDSLFSNLVNSTMLFSLLQVSWQVVFLTWHLYCVCFNITTDEWINWERYPEFQLIVQNQLGIRDSNLNRSKGEGQLAPCGQPQRTTFKNPYDKGVLQNLKDLVQAKG